jgi:hypothetical protein
MGAATVDFVDTTHPTAILFKAIGHEDHRPFSVLKRYNFDI